MRYSSLVNLCVLHILYTRKLELYSTSEILSVIDAMEIEMYLATSDSGKPLEFLMKESGERKVVATIFLFYWSMLCCAYSVSCVRFLWPDGLQPARLLCPWGFSRQEYWSGLSCPPPGDLLNPEIEPRSPALQVDSLLTEPLGKPKNTQVGSLSFVQGIFQTQKLNQGLLHC